MKRIVLVLCSLVTGGLSAVTQAELKDAVDPGGLCSSITFAPTGAWATGERKAYWMLGRDGENVEVLKAELCVRDASRFSCQMTESVMLRLDGDDWGYYYGDEIVLESGEHEMCFSARRVRADDCLTFGPFRLEKSKPLFSVCYHPQGGSCEVETQEYFAGDRYEIFPEATMPGCSLVGWSTDPWNSWNLVSEDDRAYSWTRHLYAVWDVDEPETFVDPNNAFNLWSSVDFNGDPYYEYAGHEDPEDGTWVYEPRICYLGGTARSEELLGGFVNRPGTIVFERCTCEQRMAFLIDGEESEWSIERYNCCDADDYVFDCVKIRQGGEHEFALVAEDVNGSSSAWFELGKMHWEPAPATVDVTFESCGGTASQTSKRFQPGLAYKVLPTATKADATFVGWFTQPFGGTKVEASDYVDWDYKTLYAHWRHADLAQAMGVGVRNVTTGDAELWTGENGVTLAPTNAEGRTVYWLEANCAGEGVFSFDWTFSTQVRDEESWGAVEVAFFVDGVRQDVSGDDYVSWRYQSQGGGSFSAYLAPGEHRLRWEVIVPCLYGVAARVCFGNFKNETDFASSLWDWGRLLYDCGIWRKGTLPALKAAYAAKFAQTDAGYRAAIEHALTTIALLGEDQIVAETLRKFGFDLSTAPLAISGALSFDRAPEGNALVDAAFAKVEPAIQEALSNLERIPESWHGKILCSVDEFPLDTDIYVDFADVAFARAILKAALATASWAKAYNTAVDYEILRSDMSLPVVGKPSVSPLAGGWGETVDFRDDSVFANVRAALQGGRLHLFVKKGRLYAASEECSYSLSLALSDAKLAVSGSKRRSEVHFTGNGTLESYSYGGIWWRSDDEWQGDGDAPSLLDLGEYLYFSLPLEEELLAFDHIRTVFWEVYAPDMWCDSSESCWASAMAVYEHQTHVFDKVRDMTALRAAKAHAKEALQLTQLADMRVLARGPGEFLFNYDKADDDLLQKMRQKTAEALRSLDASVDVDLSGLMLAEKIVSQMNPLCVYLGALFSGSVTRTLVPPFEDEVTFSPDLSRLPDATFGGVLPGMTQSALRELADAYEWFPHYRIKFSRGSAPYASDRMDDVKCGCHRVIRLPKCTYVYPGKRFVGWRSSANDKLYDDEMLVFDLAPAYGDVTMTAIWE